MTIPINKTQKQASMDDLKSMVDGAEIVIFTDYMGLSVAAISELRRQIRASGGRLRVIKNTLARKAFKDLGGVEVPDDFWTGPLAVVAGSDPVATAKVLTGFLKEVEKGAVKAGVSDGAFVDAAIIDMLSKMPSKEENIARILGALKSPIQKVYSQVQWPAQKLVFTLKAVAEKQAS